MWIIFLTDRIGRMINQMFEQFNIFTRNDFLISLNFFMMFSI